MHKSTLIKQLVRKIEKEKKEKSFPSIRRVMPENDGCATSWFVAEGQKRLDPLRNWTHTMWNRRWWELDLHCATGGCGDWTGFQNWCQVEARQRRPPSASASHCSTTQWSSRAKVRGRPKDTECEAKAQIYLTKGKKTSSPGRVQRKSGTETSANTTNNLPQSAVTCSKWRLITNESQS